MRILAVDFGTSNTVAAVRVDDEPARVLSFGASLMLPSGVFSSGHGLVVGAEAIRLARSDPARYEPNPKRRVDDAEVLLGTTIHPVIDLVAAVLRTVATESLRQLGRDPDQVRLTHPAHWGSLRRGLLLTAARRAGFGEALLVPEPVAAAARYAGLPGSALSPGETLAVYDLGGGTFDVALVRRDGDALSVVAEGGRGDIGGIDLDHAVLDHLTETVGRQDPSAWERLVRPVDAAGRRAARALREDVQHAKESLSDYPQTEISLPAPFEDALLTRTEFEALIRSRIAGTVSVLEQTIRTAGLQPTELAGIFLVGGASRVPMVAKEITDRLDVVPVAQDQPETAVVLGALAATAQSGQLGADAAAGVPTPATTLVLSSRSGTSAAGSGDLDADATGVIADPDRTALVTDPDRTTVVGDPDRTMVVAGGSGTAADRGPASQRGPRAAPSEGHRGGRAPVGNPGRSRPPARRSHLPMVGVAAVLAAVLVAGLLVWRPWAGAEVAGTSAQGVSDRPIPPVPVFDPSTTPSTPRSTPPSTPRSTPPSVPSSRTTRTTTTSSRTPAPAPPSTSSPFLRAIRAGKVVMAFPTSAVPGAYSDGESAVSDVTDELAVEVLKRIGGTRLSVRYTGAFGVRDEENALKTGRASMIGYTSALDDSSVLRVGPVMTDSVDLVVNADAGFSDLSSLRGATICEVFSGLTAAVKNAVGGPMTVVQANTLAECLQKQRSGTVDVVVMSTFGIDELLRQEPGRHRFIDLPLPGVPVGFAVGRGDIEGKAALEEALQSMIDDGTWRRILSGALAATGADVPKPPTIGLFDR